MDNWEVINRRLENALRETSRMQEREAAFRGPREWLRNLARAGAGQERQPADNDQQLEQQRLFLERHQRFLEYHERTMQAIDERLEQITIKLDRIAELILKGRSSNGQS
jgi:hypothetical protein